MPTWPPEATIIGNVTLKARASAWPGVVIRGDNEPIVVGEDTNIQEGSVLHTDPGRPLTLGDKVSSATRPCCTAARSAKAR
jgi:carbonic anhydrase/acetyltransferase-like protein (isoleucine patch superfamily)